MNINPEENGRVTEFQRNSKLECLLHALNGDLKYAEEELLSRACSLGPEFPVIFIVGPLRSGTTLFMQWLAQSGAVAYPTNLLSRFYGAPVIGAQIQLLLTDRRFNFRDEILDLSGPVSFESENGKTRGTLAPNEFWYFWRRFLPFEEIDWLPDEALTQAVDRDTLVGELGALTRVFGKPFALKAMILNYNIAFLDSIFRKALFIQVRRDPVANVASILGARRRQFGSDREWYSFKIPEYPLLKNFDPVTQAAGQWHFINKAVTQGMAKLDSSRKLVVDYETFCRHPHQVFNQLVVKLELTDSISDYDGPAEFRPAGNVPLQERLAIERALVRFAGK